MTFRNLARVGATGLLAAGTLAFAAVPAFAADVDFGIDIKGTTIAADASGKFGVVTVTNQGTTTPSEVGVLFDVSKLDTSKVTLDGIDECDVVDKVADCILAPPPGPGESVKTPLPFTKKDGAAGAAGSITITVKVDGDTNPANDTKTVDVSVGGHGVDMQVVAEDVYQMPADENGAPTTTPIPPGGQGLLLAYVANQGDAVASGLKVEFALPQDVTITDDLDGCTLTTDRRSASCAVDDLSLIPVDEDTTATKKFSTTGLGIAVTVSKNAKGPVALKGGEMTVAAIGQEAASDARIQSLARRGAPVVPKYLHQLTADQAKAVEVDATDNTDTFAVFVAGPQGGSGGGTGNGGGEDGGLPVTGPVAASVAGAGAAVIAIGAVLFVVTRRRRVVLVTPGDEK